MEQTATGLDYHQCYINGEWVDSSIGERIDVKNPANGKVFAQVPSCGLQDVERALVTSQAAQPAWQAMPAHSRAELLLKLCAKLEEEKAHFARLLVMEQGKTLAEAEFEVDDTIRYISYAAEAGRRIQGDIFPSDLPREQLWIQKVPYGVTVGLCAYNYPLALIGRKVGPALITGNTMILKPHELTPVTACEFCRLVDEAGFPKGVVNMVIGTGAEVGAALVESFITKLVTVTGSIRAGQAIYATAAKNITALSLELGGKAPFIVLEDADIDAAVEAAVVARFANCGQVCICNEMILVHEAIADEFTEKVLARAAQVKLGDPMKNEGMGPNTSPDAIDRIDQIVKDTVAEGATLAMGGKRPKGEAFASGYWYEPTVLTNVTKDMTAIKDEIFGPVMPIIRISGYEEAVGLCDAREEGLAAYLWTKDYSRFMHAVENLPFGTIFINKGICGYIQGYHTGHKRSGLGGEDGIYGIEGYLQKRTIYLAY